jgi:hypothetical protein
VIDDLSSVFGIEAPLTVNRGKIHEYLGMTLDYSVKGKVTITMFDYIKKLLEELPSDMNGDAVTPAANHLFDISEKPELLEEEKSVLFHHNVAKLLFLCKRARPDLQTAVAFLCTRVKCPDTDDYKKLARTLKYLRATSDLPLTLEVDNLQVIKWWIDASYAVHPDMKSHTGGIMSLGRGAVYAMSAKQKLNTKSSTESELVGVADMLPQMLWTRYFMEAQGYGINESIGFQDNTSTISLEKYGRLASSKRTRHINIRYFFVTDRIASKEVDIRWCPTAEMVGDFYTKPLQGALFRKFRDFIMNVDPSTNSSLDRRSVLGSDLKDPTVTQNVTKSVTFPNDRDTTDGTANDHKISRSRQNTRSGGRKRPKLSNGLE